MAGLVLWSNKLNVKSTAVQEGFSNIDYKPGLLYRSKEWNIIVFPKANYEYKNYFIKEDKFICCIGTFGYKGLVYNDSLPLILEDFINGKLDFHSFWGSFIVLMSIENKITIIRDSTFLTKLYSDKNNTVFSSSLASFMEFSDEKKTLNLPGMLELFTTGVITANQTIINEVKVINTFSSNEVNIVTSEQYPLTPFLSKRSAIENTTKALQNYYKNAIHDFSKFQEKPKIDVGMTSGMDSRLNVILASLYSERVVTHTHYRKSKDLDKDYRIARLFSEKSKIPLNIVKVKDAFVMSEEELKNNYEKSYNFCDGVIRAGCYWDEQYSTEWYRGALIKGNYLRLLGFGGEILRNKERIPLKGGISLAKWVRWQMMYNFAGRYFSSEVDAQKIEKRIESNLKKEFNSAKFNLNLFNFKKYLIHIESPVYRSIQSSIENRIGFCINPFLDQKIVSYALNSVPFLGKSLSFQLEIMNKLSPSLSKISNGYGFDFTKSEPITESLLSVLWQKLPPVKYKIFAKYKNYFHSDYIIKLSEKHDFIRELISEVKDIGLPLDLDKHLLFRSRSKLVLNVGYFIKRNRNKLEKITWKEYEEYNKTNN